MTINLLIYVPSPQTTRTKSVHKAISTALQPDASGLYSRSAGLHQAQDTQQLHVFILAILCSRATDAATGSTLHNSVFRNAVTPATEDPGYGRLAIEPQRTKGPSHDLFSSQEGAQKRYLKSPAPTTIPFNCFWNQIPQILGS